MSLSVIDAARELGDRDALVVAGDAFSFAELAERIATARAHLRDLDASEERPVVLRATPRLGTLLAVYAMLEDGIPFVPVHPRLTEIEARDLVSDIDVSGVIDDATFDAFEAKSSRLVSPGKNRVISDRTLATVFTSGTSGKSRGAILTRSAFETSARASENNLPWRDGDRWLLCMPLAHVGGLSIVTRCLLGRQAVMFQPRFEVDAVLATIARGDVTRVSLVPTMLFDLLAKDHDNVLAKLDTVLLGGAATAPKLLEECAQRRIRVLTTYGLTEACSQVTTQSPHDPSTVELGSGRPLLGTEVIVTRENGDACDPAEIGSIRVRSKTLMRGYVGEDPREGFFDTGDVGSFDERGALHVASRRKDVIISGGENVYPLEVEAALLACSSVAGAVVFGVSHERWGEEVVAVIAAGKDFDETRAQIELRDKLASFKTPRKVAVVSDLPKSENGKISRAEVVRVFTSQLRTWRNL